MCGIAGYISPKNPEDRMHQLAVMMEALHHRGPDDDGVFIEGNTGLGFQRLSILDLSAAGHQPMLSPDGRYVLIFNGEIFNYLEIRHELTGLGHTFQTKTDTEVLLTAYLQWGVDMLPRLNGMWAFAIYDRQEKNMFCARDRYGVKPFYYCIDEDRFIFASEITAILAVLGRKPEPDPRALYNFLLFNRTDQSDTTFFREIRSLKHGHYMLVDTQRPHLVRFRKWYDLKKELKEPFRSPEEFREMFSSSIELRLRSDVPVGVCLSGGVDSSSIVSILLKDFGKKDIYTFSAVYGEGRFGDESKFINLYRDQLKNSFFIQPNENSLLSDIDSFVQAHGEPVPTTSPYAQFKVMELASNHVTVTIDGQGADEMLAGYHYFFGFYFKDLFLNGQYGKLSSEMLHYLRKHRDLLGLKSLLFFLLPSHLRKKVRAYEKGYIDTGFCESQSSSCNLIADELYGSGSLQDALLNHFEYKLEHLLKWEDRNSMWFSMEARVPFLDFRLVERTLSLGDEAIIHKGMTKHILREAMKGTLPEKIRLRRDKMGFGTPQDEWFRTPVFQKYIRDIIHSETFASRGLLDVREVKEIYRKHLARQGNYAREIWKWIHLEHWFRRFIDEDRKVQASKRRSLIRVIK